MRRYPFPKMATIFLALVGLAAGPPSVLSQHPNPKGLTRDQVAAIHGRIFNEGEVAAIPTALAKGSGDVYIHAPTFTVTEVALDTRNQLANWMRHCELVAIGRIGASASYMTAGKGFLNTDWDFAVEEVLKNNPVAPLSSGATITVIRRGGKMKIGERTVHAVQRTYKKFGTGDRYLLFLKFIPETGAYATCWPLGFAFFGTRMVRLTSQRLHPDIEAMDEETLIKTVKEVATARPGT